MAARYAGQDSALKAGSKAVSNIGALPYQQGTSASVVVNVVDGWKVHLEGPIRARLMAMGTEMVEEAQILVPVATGRLQDSIHFFISGRGLNSRMWFGATAPYAMFVEFGHHTRSGSWVPAQPFIRPVVYKHRGGVG